MSTFNDFLRKVVADCVENGSGEWPQNAPRPGEVLAAHYRSGLRDANTPAQEETPVGFGLGLCVHCGRRAKLDDDGWCSDCDQRDPAYEAELERRRENPTEEMLRGWAEGVGSVVALAVNDESLPEAAVYTAARKAAGYALDALGRE